jgi:hypothetical protein
MTRMLLLVAAVTAGLSGCATPARDISWDPLSGTGIVAIPANSNMFPTYYRNEALALIEKRVGPNYEIVEEREVPIGQTTLNNQQLNNDSMLGITTTKNLTEYHIAYRKKALPTTVTPGLPGAGSIQQTQFRPGTGGVGTGGVQPAGGMLPPGAPGNTLVPSVAPVNPAGGLGSGTGVSGAAGASVGGIR